MKFARSEEQLYILYNAVINDHVEKETPLLGDSTGV